MNETKVSPKLYHYHGNLIKWASHSFSSLLWSSLFTCFTDIIWQELWKICDCLVNFFK